MLHGTEEEVRSKHGEAVKLFEVVAIVPPPVVHPNPRHLSRASHSFFPIILTVDLIDIC